MHQLYNAAVKHGAGIYLVSGGRADINE